MASSLSAEGCATTAVTNNQCFVVRFGLLLISPSVFATARAWCEDLGATQGSHFVQAKPINTGMMYDVYSTSGHIYRWV